MAGMLTAILAAGGLAFPVRTIQGRRVTERGSSYWALGAHLVFGGQVVLRLRFIAVSIAFADPRVGGLNFRRDNARPFTGNNPDPFD